MMLLVAFAAALLGVMVLHKLRERRIFHLLVKEKDQELMSLQLLLQKERDHSNEMKRKNEEMKERIYALRTKKMELDRRILEKQSTIDSLKDEQKTMEAALEEKQNEIKMLRENEIDPGKENPQVIALMESVKQKEAEMEDLKHRLENPIKVWSGSTDDPSNPPVNSTVNGSNEGEAKTDHNSAENVTRSEDKTRTELNNFRKSEVIATIEDEGEAENKVGDSDRRDTNGEQTQKPQESQEGVNGEGRAIVEPTDEGQGNQDEDSRDNIVKAVEKLEVSQEHDSQELPQTHRGGIKLEDSDNSGNETGSRNGRRHGHTGKTKAKRWRMLVRKRRLENNGNSVNNDAVGMRSRQIFLDDEDGSKRRTSEEGEVKRDEGEMGTKDLKNIDVNADSAHQAGEGRGILLENPHSSANGRASNITMDAEEQKQDKVSSSINKVENDTDDTTTENSEDSEVVDTQEQEKVAVDDDFIREATSEEEEEEYKEETEEPEF